MKRKSTLLFNYVKWQGSPDYPPTINVKTAPRLLKDTKNEELLKEIKVIHHKIEAIFGYRRMNLNLNRKFNKQFNYKRIY
ncbi:MULTISPECIES: transposase [Bacillati]|uniref:transposase n=1 Tax=Bacillati TaxID=1783272 RepID=UPI00208B2AAD|nr:hypothetical protein NCCP28_36030 [Niallia sp. NCCP-28]